KLVVSRDRRRVLWSTRFAADIDDVRTLDDQRVDEPSRVVDGLQASAVAVAVGRDVDDPEYAWLVESEKSGRVSPLHDCETSSVRPTPATRLMARSGNQSS